MQRAHLGFLRGVLICSVSPAAARTLCRFKAVHCLGSWSRPGGSQHTMHLDTVVSLLPDRVTSPLWTIIRPLLPNITDRQTICSGVALRYHEPVLRRASSLVTLKTMWDSRGTILCPLVFPGYESVVLGAVMSFPRGSSVVCPGCGRVRATGCRVLKVSSAPPCGHAASGPRRAVLDISSCL